MRFKIYGPYEIPRKKTEDGKNKEKIDLSDEPLSEFWNEVERDLAGLSYGEGCYVFGIRYGRGTLPWYVGKVAGGTITNEKTGRNEAKADSGFKKECFQPGKVLIFEDVLDKIKRGKPVLYLVVNVSEKKEEPSKSTKNDVHIEWIEDILIGMAIKRNPELSNVKGTLKYTTIELPGILTKKKKLNQKEMAFQKMMLTNTK